MRKAVDADLVVVGAGLSGLTAANRSLEAGLQVVILEAGADESYLCNSRIASGSFNIAHCDPTAGESVVYSAIMSDTDGAADPAIAQSISRAMNPAMRWFRAEGAKFIKITRPGAAASTWSLAPPRPANPGFGWQGRGPDLALRTLLKNFASRGGTIIRRARARDILMAGGACAGVRADCGDSSVIARAPQIVLADGGFQANPELVRRFISPRPERLVQRNARTGVGDALLMAEKLNAKLVGMNRFYGHLLVQEALSDDLLWPYPTIDTLASSAVVIDQSGRRFLDEGVGGVAMANHIAGLDDPLSATAIFDDAMWRSTGRLDFTPPNPFLVSSGGTLTTRRTLKELEEALALPANALTQTIATYNQALGAGRPEALDPPRSPGRVFGVLRSSATRTEMSPLVEPPFHAIRLCAGLTYTMGGVAIDGAARVIDRQGEIIPGLYAVGSCAGGAEGGPAAGYIGGLCKALSLGFIAAQDIARKAAERHEERRSL